MPRSMTVFHHAMPFELGMAGEADGVGAKVESGKSSFKELEAYMLKKGDAAPNASGRQEYLENLINEFI